MSQSLSKTAMKNGKPSFDEDYVSPRIDPLAPPGAYEFDFTEVERALGELPGEPDREAVVRFISAVFHWATAVDLDDHRAQTFVGRRFLALAWVVSPALFEGMSAAALAQRIGIKSVNKFQRLTGAASREFRLKNRSQAHAWNGGHNAAG